MKNHFEAWNYTQIYLHHSDFSALFRTLIAKTFTFVGKTAYGALTEWFNSKGRTITYLDDLTVEPSCNPSCCTVNCYKCQPFIHQQNDSNNFIKEYKKNNYNNNNNNYKNRPIVYYSSSTIKNRPLLIMLVICLCVLHLMR